MKTTFDFMNLTSEYSFILSTECSDKSPPAENTTELLAPQILPDIMVHLDRTSHSVAVIYFTDNQNPKKYIPIPKGIVVYTYDFQDTKRRVIQEPINSSSYGLCWTENYEVEYNGKIILELKNKRCWDVILTEF